LRLQRIKYEFMDFRNFLSRGCGKLIIPESDFGSCHGTSGSYTINILEVGFSPGVPGPIIFIEIHTVL